MDGKLVMEIEQAELGPFADADPEWLRRQILPARDRYERDPSSLSDMEDVFRRLKDELLGR